MAVETRAVTGNVKDPGGTGIVGATVNFYLKGGFVNGTDDIVPSGPVVATTITAGAYTATLATLAEYRVEVVVAGAVIDRYEIDVTAGTTSIAASTLRV